MECGNCGIEHPPVVCPKCGGDHDCYWPGTLGAELACAGRIARQLGAVHLLAQVDQARALIDDHRDRGLRRLGVPSLVALPEVLHAFDHRV